MNDEELLEKCKIIHSGVCFLVDKELSEIEILRDVWIDLVDIEFEYIADNGTSILDCILVFIKRNQELNRQDKEIERWVYIDV